MLFSQVIQAIVFAFNWCWEGFYGTLRAMIYAHSDVPTLQCLIGTAAFIVPVILIDIFIVDRIKKAKRKKEEFK